MRGLFLVFFLCAVLATPNALADDEGKLTKMKSDLKKTTKTTTSNDEDSFWVEILYWWAQVYIEYTFSDLGFRYLEYPYQDGRNVYLTDIESSSRPFALEILFGYQYINSETNATFFDSRLRIPSGNSFSLCYLVFEEELKTGGYEYISFYSFTQRASLKSNQPLDISLDFGVNHFPGMNRGGFSYGFGVEIFPFQPIVLSFYFRQHIVAGGQDVLEAFFGIGVSLCNIEPTVGYRVFDFHGFGGGVALSGLFLGVRVRL
ncbi:MAG: hypothetical protein N2234_01545 [Planctomycetota bacterium]|nr:hypothetical protein [Planctomycetota bacterium]